MNQLEAVRPAAGPDGHLAPARRPAAERPLRDS